MAAEAKSSAFITSFISRSVPSVSHHGVKHSGREKGADLATLCRHLVNAAGPVATEELYGEEIRSEVDERLSFASAAQADRDPVSASARLRTLDAYLVTRTVMLNTGTSTGIADIAMFLSIHDSVAALSAKERDAYPNLLRWMDYVQNKDDQSHAYEWIPVVKPKFDPPVSSAESDSKKGPPAAQIASIKDKSAGLRQQKLVTKAQEENGSSHTTGASQVDGPKDNQKEKTAKPEALSAGKVDVGDDIKKVQQKEKKEPAPAQKVQQKEKKEPAPAQAQKDAFGLEILDIRVGVIKTVKRHPTADTLYVEEIDIGEGSLRQVVSGLAKYLTEEEMLNRRVLVLANVKPSKLRDVMSSGLVLCTSNDDHSQCEPVIPPKEAKIGERVTAQGYEGKPEAVLNPKKKQWDKIYPDLHTNDAGVACYKGGPLTTSAGPCTSSITNGTIK